MISNLPTKKRASINRLLKQKKHEDYEMLVKIEKNILFKKKSIFKLPKPFSPVIVPFSGGTDSTVLLYILIKVFKLIVYPYYVADQKRSKIEIRTAKKVIKEIKRSHPRHIHDLKVYINNNTSWSQKNGELNKNNRSLVNTIIDFRQHFGLIHAHYLQQKSIISKTIICGINADDGDYNPSQTLTNMRLHQLEMIVKTGDKNWQFSSLFIERELGFYFSKPELMIIGKKLGAPLSQTWSCFKAYPIHCGICGNCQIRKMDFEKARIKDRTLYLDQIPQLINIPKKIIKKVIKKI